MEDVPRDAGERDALRRAVQRDPLAGRGLVSADGRVTALVVHFLPMSNREFLARELDERVAELARDEARGGAVWVTGGPRLRAVTARALDGLLGSDHE